MSFIYWRLLLAIPFCITFYIRTVRMVHVLQVVQNNMHVFYILEISIGNSLMHYTLYTCTLRIVHNYE
jgi:hypothetical protein